MKRNLLLILIFAMTFLIACRPVAPAASQDETDQVVVETEAPEVTDVPGTAERPTLPPEPTMTTEDETTSPPTGFNDQQSENNEGAIPVPAFEWDTDPGALILVGTDCCGFTTRQVVMNYIPSFQLWGDGHMIWAMYPETGGRLVMEAFLTEDQVREFLQRAANEGFYDWNNRYENLSIADAANTCITLNLTEASKMVCEYFEGAPEAFHNLYSFFSSGSGIEGMPYIPDRGFLIAEMAAGDVTLSQTPYNWTPTGTDDSLKNAGGGIWVEGELLAGAWNALNSNPFIAVFEENGERYFVSIQIPEVSMLQPGE